MTDDYSKRYLAVVQLRPDTTVADLARRIPALQNYFERMAKGEAELAFRSSEGQLFGILFRTSKPIGMIRSELDGMTGNGDTFLIIEAGAFAAEKGFGRIKNWLEYH